MGMDGDNGVGNSADGDIPRGRCEYRRWSVDLQGCTVARLADDAERMPRGGDNTGIVLRVAPDTWSARRRANDAVVVVGRPENASFRQRGGPGIATLPIYAERIKGRAHNTWDGARCTPDGCPWGHGSETRTEVTLYTHCAPFSAPEQASKIDSGAEGEKSNISWAQRLEKIVLVAHTFLPRFTC